MFWLVLFVVYRWGFFLVCIYLFGIDFVLVSGVVFGEFFFYCSVFLEFFFFFS